MTMPYPLRNTFLGILLLWAMWLSSIWLYDLKKTGEALDWRDAILTGATPFSWTFNKRDDLAGGNEGHELPFFTAQGEGQGPEDECVPDNGAALLRQQDEGAIRLLGGIDQCFCQTEPGFIGFTYPET